MNKSLWQQSSAWRWTVILTVHLSIAAIFGSPWFHSSSGVQNARYTVPPPSSTSGGQANRLQGTGYINATALQMVGGAASGYVSGTAQANLRIGNGQTASASYPAPKKIDRDATFDISVPRPAEIYPPGTELHMMGLYEGAVPEGEKDTPWWAKCQSKDGRIIDPTECHKKYAGLRTPREVTVEIRYGAPLVLALMAYNPVIWNIKGEASAQLQKVILSGYHGQDIRGIEDRVPVDVYTYEDSNCRNCRKRSGNFYAYQESGPQFANAVIQLKKMTGLSPSSFQGAYQGRFFSLTPSIVGKIGLREPVAASTEPASGKTYSDHITVANTVLPLPAGSWQTIVYAKVTSNHKENSLISMAQIIEGNLQSLFAARVEFSDDNKGFDSNYSCTNGNNFFEQTVSNIQGGAQLCYWVEHLSSPWTQPLFDMTAAKLRSMGVTVPTDAINIGFHKATLNTSITTYVYANPEAESIYTQPTSWHASPWNNSRIQQDPQRQAFMEKQLHWAETWFQFFRLD